MRTTLDIDDSVLSAIKELAQRQGKTAGEVISTLARQALLQGSTPQPRQDKRTPGQLRFSASVRNQ